MTRQDYIDLIKVAEAVIHLEEGCHIITGHGLEEGDCTDIFKVWEILKRNTSDKYQTTCNQDDSKEYQRFIDILENKELTSEEKFEMLMN